MISSVNRIDIVVVRIKSPYRKKASFMIIKSFLTIIILSTMAFSEEALPQSAVKIIESYNQQVEKAGMVFAASKKMSAVEAIKKLSIEQQKYTKSGDLDNALAIKSKIDYYKEEITSGDMGRISAKIAVDMIDFPKFDEGKIKKVNFKAEVKASSSFDLTFAPGNAIDGMLSSEWASRGSVGDITITLKSPVRATKIYLVSRGPGDDPIADGSVVINESLKIPIINFQTNSVMIIKLAEQAVIQSITLNCVSGRNNPGLKEVFLE